MSLLQDSQKFRITHKTKPLGPRQRRAYQKPYEAAIVEAKAKLAAEQARVAAETAAYEKAVRRWSGAVITTDAQGGRHAWGQFIDTASIWGLREKLKDGRRKVRQRILAGAEGYSVSIGTGSPKAANAVKRIRRVPKADIRKRARLEAALAKARKALDDHLVEAWDHAEPMTVEQLADALIGLAAAKPPYRYLDEYAVLRAEQALGEAKKHDGTASCPCEPCVAARRWDAQDRERVKQDAARAKARERAEAKRPKVTFTCPDADCAHITEHAPVEIDENDGLPYVECERCEQGWTKDDGIAALATLSPGQLELAAMAA